jgi:FMNH2-dependent dimethyl sulfone monooxygenase
MDRETGQAARAAMYSANRLKLGLFGANCSSGRAVTLVPERWSGSWPDCLRLAQMADDAGIEFMLPIGRWKGYGGDTDYQGATFETVTWACGLLAATKRLTVFGTVHAPLIPPLIAAKQFVTADHIGEGRFGLNVVCGWNEGEFEMFGATLRDHETRYDYAQEWLDVIKLAWSPCEDFDFDGRFIKLKGVRAKPKPHGGTRPLIMNAGASPTGQAFAIRNCDALFSNVSNGISFDETAHHVANVRAAARQDGRDIGVYTVGVVTCRPTVREARDYWHHCVVDNADWRAVDNILAMKNVTPDKHAPQEFQRLRAAIGRRSRCGGAADGAARRRRPHRDRGVVRQLPRRAALFLRRNIAAPGPVGPARKNLNRHSPNSLSQAIEKKKIAFYEVTLSVDWLTR